MATWLWVGVGGFFGAVARWVVSGWFRHTDFPAGTLTVNLLGSFLMGVLVEGFVEEVFALPVPFRLFFLVGFLGSFTTFSTFSLETIRLLEGRNIPALLAYGAQAILGPGTVFFGMVLVRALTARR